MTFPEPSLTSHSASTSPGSAAAAQPESSGRLFVFAGGGTGGHLAPGIAVAAELHRREPDCRIRFVGSGRPIEQRMLGPTGYELTAHDAPPLAQLKRRPLHFLKTHWQAIRAARRDFQRDRPAAVIGLGGFASVPIVLAAQREGIPVLLLEQNVIPGRANWWLSRRHPICVTFAETRQHLPRRATCHVTGNPLREDIVATDSRNEPGVAGFARIQPHADNPPTLLILGGSHGSRQVNESVLSAVRDLRESFASWHILHQTGPDGCDEARRVYADCGLSATVEPFFDDLPQLYARTTLAISRAGATTLTELAAAGIPSLLIPYPFAAADHQTHNARTFATAGAALVVNAPRKSAAPVNLTEPLRSLLTSPARLTEMQTAARTLSQPNATRTVCDVLGSITG